MFQIGEFSIITKLSVKTLRYYHNEGLLEPDYIDDDSGYRYYKESSVDKARILSFLRDMEFSITDIKEILSNYSEDTQITDFLEAKQNKIKLQLKKYHNIEANLQSTIETIRRNEMLSKKLNISTQVEEKHIDDFIFAGHRMTGMYSEIGKAFRIVAKKAGRYIRGKAMTLYYDNSYKEKDADMEGGFPVAQMLSKPEVDCRTLEGGKAVTIIHKGPYQNFSKSYEKNLKYIEDKKYKIKLPHREIYLKGPGMIFRGNPEKYITEIQMFIDE